METLLTLHCMHLGYRSLGPCSCILTSRLIYCSHHNTTYIIIYMILTNHYCCCYCCCY